MFQVEISILDIICLITHLETRKNIYKIKLKPYRASSIDK